MANAVEIPSASRINGDSGIVQRTETGSHRRNNVPVKRGKDCDPAEDLNQRQTGDSSRENGGTQKLLPKLEGTDLTH